MKIKNGIRLRKLGHHYMIVMPKGDVVDMSEVLTLNESAAFIWNRAVESGCFTREQVLAWILGEYEVDEQTAIRDIDATLKNWEKLGLVE